MYHSSVSYAGAYFYQANAKKVFQMPSQNILYFNHCVLQKNAVSRHSQNAVSIALSNHKHYMYF